MGTLKNKEAIKYYEKVFTSPNHPDEDDFTAHLTLYSKEISSGIEFDTIAKSVIVKLITHGVHNRRLNWIIRYCGKMLLGILASPSTVREAHLACLRLMGLILRRIHALGRCRSEALVELIGDDLSELSLSTELASRGSKDAQKLCELLLEYATQVKLDVNTVVTHAEVASLLLSMCSSTLHHPTHAEETSIDMFLEMILNHERLEALVGVLLRCIIDWNEYPEQMKPILYNADPKLTLTKLFSWFTGPSNDDHRARSEKAEDLTNPAIQSSCSYWELTFRHLAQFLALLVIYQRGNKPNPVVEYIKKLKDGQVVRFPALIKAIATRLPRCPSLCTLLYVFLYDHDSFLPDILASDSRQLMGAIQSLQNLSYVVCINVNSHEAPSTTLLAHGSGGEDGSGVEITKSTHSSSSLAHLMYNTTQFSYPFICFMTATLLLMLSQVSFLRQQAFRMLGLQTLPLRRYAARELTVGASYLIVMAVGIGKAVKDHNEQLALLYASCMNNLALQVRDIDSYTSQRLLMLVVFLLKRMQFLEREYQLLIKDPGENALNESLKPASTQPGAFLHSEAQSRIEMNPPIGRTTEEIESDGQLYLNLLDIVVEALDVMLLRDLNCNNECLVYELLYHRDKIIISCPFKDQGSNPNANTSEFLENSEHFIPYVREILSNLSKCILSYETELASVPNTSKRNEVIHIIRQFNQAQGSSESLQESSKEDARDGSFTPCKFLDIDKSLMSSPKPSVSADDIAENAKTFEIPYVYEESPHSYDFFAPFVWSTMLNDARFPGGILWCSNIKELPLFLS
ncbi:unnamed protein product [Phytomonas sp. Hart1]|nr:unnamed protein product [Phytomonas sp. Hart1]|eukprot:CCW71305.1 unnamed protein product [Phytomonas sp. isolate Hart1]